MIFDHSTGHPLPARSGPIDAAQYDPIHKEAPVFTDQSTEQEVLSTGIKVSYYYHID